MEFHVDIGPQYEGEVIRKDNLYMEFGGPKAEYKFELATVKSPDEIEHEKVEIIGPDINELEPYDPETDKGGSYPIAILIDVAGSELDKDAEPVIERKIHMYSNFVEGIYHMNQRQDVWIRLSREAYKKGFNSLRELGEIYNFLFTSEMPIIEKIQTTIITDIEKIKELYPEALKRYQERDERARQIKDEDVDTFYGCILCQSFAPTHMCVIAPNRIANCGAINWFDGRAASKIDPEGPIFAVPKGELLDETRGEYEGVNKVVAEKSLGTYDRVYLYSAFGYPHTSCGCFQAIVFYIPEVDAFGIVHREYKGLTVLGITFTKMAGETSGGKQIEGRLGTGLEQIRSPKFLQADGGLARIVWMPKEIKERYKDVLLAKGLYDKIATEEDVKNVDELIAFLEKVGHPWIKGEVELPA
ncbi:MAG: CO dehydrogenase/CO-methylating acetyl-CoA synthase complex subunit beta [Deltaproteobacteria bacterium]|nr:CO dehydrogenase/CO-methylating acetyl-CoA synthase complex subunit beta [Deltaproteobacteria bacterium]